MVFHRQESDPVVESIPAELEPRVVASSLEWLALSAAARFALAWEPEVALSPSGLLEQDS